MEKFIERMYRNRLFDGEKVLKGERTEELKLKNRAAYDLLSNNLTDEQKNLLNSYENSTNLFFDDQLYLTFEQGFIIGARLALEISGLKKTDLAIDKTFDIFIDK